MTGRAATQVRAPKRANYAVTECVNAHSAMHLHIHAKVHTVGIEPEAQPHAAQNVTQLTKYESSKPQIADTLTDIADLAYSQISPFSGDIDEVGENSQQPHRSLPFSARSVRSGRNSHRPRRSRRFSAMSSRSAGILIDLADFPAMSLRSVGILIDLADFQRSRRCR